MIRGIGLRGAVAVNVITMIGIGPLITIPLVLADLHGSIALVAWGVGALIALCDGLAWAELGSLYPGSGGTYVFLRETFGARSWGRMLAFLFTWQIVLAAPLVLASGYIGFAQYAGYLWPGLASNARLQGELAAAVGIVTLVALYRPITTIGKLGIVLAGVAVATLGANIVAAASRFSPAQALSGDVHVGTAAALGAGLGPALVITLYDYYGYGQSCTVSDEVRDTRRVLPLSVVVSILGVGVLYVLLQLGVLGVVPWQQLVPATIGGSAPAAAGHVASTVVERAWGAPAAVAVTLAILVTAFASVFGNLLGYSRIPYASAVDGTFLRPFAHLDARGRFPNVSLVTIGLLALPACFLSLGDVINALTTGLVIIQSIAQLVAVVFLRVRGIRAPYRMWLFPLPLLLALAGWIYIFCSAGTSAVIFGCVTLAAGIIVYVVRARFARDWPFLRKAGAAAAFAGVTFAAVGQFAQAAQSSPAWGHAAIVERDGNPIFEVDGRPFFVYGAAFFYERLPRDQWRSSLEAHKRLGINTLDLYVPWNWHELADGNFDFDGRTSPRRDLDEVLRLARTMDFKILLRPGPVIRNEWRNGGYPAWLLQRPEYGMPLHDLLEGRYPPTATLQNAHSDDAAAQWLRNATHVKYARRWLERVLRECAPDADRILAVALDDDQGAYIDNQTYPAPHLRAYLEWLRSVVHGVTGVREPVFINTYQMKVPASSPVWTMGNWYQSETYSIGEHDRAQLEFSTGLLHTRPHQPMMSSEFQAGWLEGPNDVRPRPADPSDTSLALATMIGMGVRGVVSFPAQDTLYPSGWEAPFANAFYAWDAALGIGNDLQARGLPTAAFGTLVKRFGPQLAASSLRYDAAIAYLGASYDSRYATNVLFGNVETATTAAQQACRDAGMTCTLIDLEAESAAAVERYPMLILPRVTGAPPLRDDVAARIATYARRRKVVPDVTGAAPLRAALRTLRRRLVVEGVPGATFARDTTGRFAGFLTVANYSGRELNVPRGATVALDDRTRVALPAFAVGPHAGVVVPVLRKPPAASRCALRNDPAASRDGPAKALRASAGIPIRNDARLPVPQSTTPPLGIAVVYRGDAFRDGTGSITFDNGLVRLIVSPNAGARAFVFEDDARRQNVFTSVGAMRDDVSIEPPLSTTDRIAKYTHQFPAGMFNRPYLARDLSRGKRAVAGFDYDAPDVLPHGATFSRVVEMDRGERAFALDEHIDFKHRKWDDRQRAVSVTSLSVGDTATAMTTQEVLAPEPSHFAKHTTLHVIAGHVLGYYDTATHELATIAWRSGDVEDAAILEQDRSIVVRLTFATSEPHVRFGYVSAASLDDASANLAAAESAAQVHRAHRSPQVAPLAPRTP